MNRSITITLTISRISLIAACVLCCTSVYAQSTFDPPTTPVEIRVEKATDKINIDGNLDEASWKYAKPITELVQYEPRQGEAPSLKTEIRILFDEKNLYFSGVCYDSAGREGIRVPNMQRDFNFGENDLLGIAIDGLLDKRNAMVFQTNPYGAQRELLSSDGSNFNREWISLWSVKTKIHDWGWTAEFAIPWKSIRYKAGSDRMGFILLRSMRRLNQNVTFPAIPRVFTPYQMPYEAILTGLELPPDNGVNVQLNPYVLVSGDRETKEGATKQNSEVKVGGEAKWALSTNSVLDVTYNTDFAQVDVDRQVVNLARFSVLFPERRQFFLEGNEIYTQAVDALQPFFSRRIGLDDNGNPIPIEAGVRFTNRSPKRNIGALAVRQRAQGVNPASNFAVARYSHNLTDQGTRIGGLATFRYDEADTSGRTNANSTVTIDGLYRPNQKLNVFWMLSGSNNSGILNNQGWSGSMWAYYDTNDIYVGHVQAVVSDKYDPRSGFVDATNYVLTSPAVSWKWRPSWLPKKWLRQFTPGVTGYFYHYYNDLNFREGFISYRPFSLNFQNGGSFSYSFVTNWQNLIESFSPLGIEIAAGDYAYNNHSLSFETDNSRKLFFSAEYNNGGYFNGTLQSVSASARIAPDPHVALTLSYRRNEIKNLGVSSSNVTTDLATAEIRLALNPRVQWISFYQYNSAINRNTFNTRLQWEYKPLSFIFIVLNDNRQDFTNRDTNITSRQNNQQGVFKITYLKQF
jgi:Domain of unknown function (DUF5916)/Carbohydrate family 9 binding domain-like